MVELNPLTVQHLDPKVTEEISADHKLVIFQVENTDLFTLHAWIKQVMTTLQNWPAGHPCLMMHDFHKCGGGILSADLHDDLNVLHQLRPDLARCVALVLPPTADVEAVQLAINTRDLGVSSRYPIHWELFTHRKDALKWLSSQDG
jgi:hypothetical protein